MSRNAELAFTQSQVVDAITHVREAMILTRQQELRHEENGDEPCEAAHLSDDAAVRSALQSSEEAMVNVLESLPPVPREFRQRPN